MPVGITPYAAVKSHSGTTGDTFYSFVATVKLSKEDHAFSQVQIEVQWNGLSPMEWCM